MLIASTLAFGQLLVFVETNNILQLCHGIKRQQTARIFEKGWEPNVISQFQVIPQNFFFFFKIKIKK